MAFEKASGDSMKNDAKLDQWQKEAAEFLEGKDLLSFESIDCRRLNARIVMLISALKKAIPALHYAEEDQADRYYTNVLEEIERILSSE